MGFPWSIPPGWFFSFLVSSARGHKQKVLHGRGRQSLHARHGIPPRLELRRLQELHVWKWIPQSVSYRVLPTRGNQELSESQAHPTDLLQVQVLGPAASSSARKQHGYDSELILSLGSARRRPTFSAVGWMVIRTKSVGVLSTIQPMALRNIMNNNNNNLMERFESPQTALYNLKTWNAQIPNLQATGIYLYKQANKMYKIQHIT